MKARVRGRINGHCRYCRRYGCSRIKRFIHRFIICDDWKWQEDRICR